MEHRADTIQGKPNTTSATLDDLGTARAEKRFDIGPELIRPNRIGEDAIERRAMSSAEFILCCLFHGATSSAAAPVPAPTANLRISHDRNSPAASSRSSGAVTR